MEKISIGNKKKLYEIESIMPRSKTVMKIVFPEDEDVPETWGGDIQVYTEGGIRCSVLSGYETVYLIEGRTVYLSNDGNVYVPPEPIPEPEPYVPTLEEVKASKESEVNNVCSSIIKSGITVTLTDGTSEHFDLSFEDQLAFLLAERKVAAGKEMIPWHPNGNVTLPCVFYTNADMSIITEAVERHISYHQTYCNSLKIWIEDCETVEEVQQIFYGADVPEEYQSEVLKAYLIQIAGMAGGGGENEETDM